MSVRSAISVNSSASKESRERATETGGLSAPLSEFEALSDRQENTGKASKNDC